MSMQSRAESSRKKLTESSRLLEAGEAHFGLEIGADEPPTRASSLPTPRMRALYDDDPTAVHRQASQAYGDDPTAVHRQASQALSSRRAHPIRHELVREDPRAVKVMDWIGAFLTFLAMVPQGELGLLLMDEFLTEVAGLTGNVWWHPVLRVGGDLVVGVAAEEGKRWLVRFFNHESFKNLGRPQWWRETFDFTGRVADGRYKWRFMDYVSFLINGAFTLNASNTFAGLTFRGFNDIDKLLLKNANKFTRGLAMITAPLPVQIPIAVSSGIANILGFPFIHKGAIGLIKDGAYYSLGETPAWRDVKEKVQLRIEKLRLLWKQAVKTTNIEAQNQLLGALLGQDGFTREDKDVNELIIDIRNVLQEDDWLNHLLSISQNKYSAVPAPKRESWALFGSAHVLAAVVTAACMYGFLSFVQMTKDALTFEHIPDAYHSHDALGWMDFASMCMLALSAAYPAMLNATRGLAGRGNPTRLISDLTFGFILAGILAVCLIGGTPNAYQTFVTLAPLWSIILAGIVPTPVEAGGFMALVTEMVNKRAIKNDGSKQVILEVDKMLTDAQAKVEQLEVEPVVRAAVAHVPEANLLPASSENLSRYTGAYKMAQLVSYTISKAPTTLKEMVDECRSGSRSGYSLIQ